MKSLRNLFVLILAVCLCIPSMLAASAAEPAPLPHTADGRAVRASAELYLSFDNGIQDDRGKYTLTKNGDIPTVDSIVGKAGHFADGNFLTIENYDFGTDSFTVSVWLNVHKISDDPLILSNKDWSTGANPGMAFAVESGKWILNVNTPGGTRADRKITLTEVSEYCENNFNTWIFLTFVVDRDAHTITGFFDGHQIGDPVDFSQNKQNKNGQPCCPFFVLF